MNITALMDDYCPKADLHGEHGLAYFIKTPSASILFDTGQSGAFLGNAHILSVDLAGLDAVILSHGHYDHTSGLADLYSAIAPARPVLYAGKGFSIPKQARRETGLAEIGIPARCLVAPVPAATEVDAVSEVFPGIFLMPRAERVDGSESLPRFRIRVEGEDRIDGFDDELSLVVDTTEGLVVITGCAHRGILNIAEAARKRFPGRPVSALVGGFHLGDLPDETLDRVADGIAALSPKQIFCGHCTGTRGFAAISARNRGNTQWLACGMTVEI
ncbi:MAG: MBL fold metallo-hydrolase [Spirochaetia bacterium]|jgi:7,8-dihydropterin-6-yl-methyl-4-(beta-D-ribofuranosyl)aminobenzene 5'-phosphate synthase|nr:MBL fold metallo-hydrolase [Spirochaetia bacterium]